MDNTLMIGLSRQITLRRDMDVIANNIANANTAGFKVEHLLLESAPAQRAETRDGPSDLQFVDNWGVGRDFRQGELAHTGRPLDLAIEGEGFIGLQTEDGERFTRDGRLRLDGEGQLVAADGAPVLDDTRNPILIDENLGPVTITNTGTVMQGQAQIARIGIFSPENIAGMEKQGDGRYAAIGETEVVDDPTVRQGYVEQSNVQPVMELTRMISIMRTYESVSKFLSKAEDLNSKAIERLGRSA